MPLVPYNLLLFVQITIYFIILTLETHWYVDTRLLSPKFGSHTASFEPLNQTCWCEKLLIKLESCYSDLSGNQFSGPYPLSQISSMNGLQELSLAGNLFEGSVPDDAILNKTQLDKL